MIFPAFARHKLGLLHLSCLDGALRSRAKLSLSNVIRMREYGSVSIPQEAFIAALRMGEE